MSDRQRQIIAIGGGGFYRDPENLGLETLHSSTDEYVRDESSVCAYGRSAEPDSYLVSFYTAFLKLGCRPSHLSFFKRTPDPRAYLLKPRCDLCRWWKYEKHARGLA